MEKCGTTVLIKNKDGSPATWKVDFLPRAYSFRCNLTVDDKSYRGIAKSPEKAMGNAVNRYLRSKGRIV